MDTKRAQEITKLNNSLGGKNKQLIQLQSDSSILKVRWGELQSEKDIQIIQLQSEKDMPITQLKAENHAFENKE